MLNHSEQTVAPYGVTVLPEIHEHYSIQLKIADQDYYVYDFALPMLVLHALFSGKVNRLVHWLEICPRKQFTTLDTHDGIGVVDVKDLLSDEEAEMTRESLYSQGANVKKYIALKHITTLIFTKSTVPIIQHLGMMIRLICWREPSNALPQVYRRFIMWGY